MTIKQQQAVEYAHAHLTELIKKFNNHETDRHDWLAVEVVANYMESLFDFLPKLGVAVTREVEQE